MAKARKTAQTPAQTARAAQQAYLNGCQGRSNVIAGAAVAFIVGIAFTGWLLKAPAPVAAAAAPVATVAVIDHAALATTITAAVRAALPAPAPAPVAAAAAPRPRPVAKAKAKARPQPRPTVVYLVPASGCLCR